MNQNIRIERAENGYTVSFRDPELEEKNRKSDKWVDSEVSYVFADMEKLQSFLTENIDTILTTTDSEEYETSFQAALKEG